MAKVRLGNPSSNVLPKAKGVFFVRDDPLYGPIAQSWGVPGKRVTNSPGKFYARQEFGIAAHWASNTFDLDIETASNMAQGTTLVYRDILIKAMYGRLWDFQGPDGQQWTPARDVTPNAQLTLDQITTQTGSMVWRSDIGWVQVNPGSNGEALINQDGAPKWLPQNSGGGSSNLAYQRYAPPLASNFPTLVGGGGNLTLSDTTDRGLHADYGTAYTSNPNIKAALLTKPSLTDYSIIMRWMAPVYTFDRCHWGLFFSDGTKYAFWGFRNWDSLVCLQTFSTLNAYATLVYSSQAQGVFIPEWLRVDVVAGVPSKWFISANGIDWLQLSAYTLSSYFTFTRIGFGMALNKGSLYPTTGNLQSMDVLYWTVT